MLDDWNPKIPKSPATPFSSVSTPPASQSDRRAAMSIDTPSEAAKRKACELANAQGCLWSPDVPIPPLYALALHLDEVDRVARAAAQHAGRFDQFNQRYVDALRSLMLPDPVDPLEEILGRVTAKQLRAELDKRGLTIAPKEQGTDEELAREVAKNFGRGPHMANETAHHAALATIKRLREQGRLADAK